MGMKQDVLAADSETSVVRWPGGDLTFYVNGSVAEFGGATIKLQSSPDNVTWHDVDQVGDTYVTLTEQGRGNATIGKGYIRAVSVGGDSNTAVKVSAG